MDMQFPYVSKYIDAIGDKTSRLNPIYIRNFRELLKLIPYVESIIDAHTFGAIGDRILERRLSELEEICKDTLKLEDTNLLIGNIYSINTILFTVIAQYQELILKEHTELKIFLKTYLCIPQNISDIFHPDPAFTFVIISGVSGTGKDILVDLLYNNYFPKHSRCELLTKYTTREKRPTDSKYYKFLNRNQFQDCMKEGRLLFKYSKRNAEYGFDKLHFSTAAITDTLLLCIFTEFRMLPTVKQLLKEQGINVVSILLEAKENHLVNRTLNRPLPEGDIRERIRSIKQDLAYINLIESR